MVVLFDIEWRSICLTLLAGHITEGTCNKPSSSPLQSRDLMQPDVVVKMCYLSRSAIAPHTQEIKSPLFLS